MPVGLATILVKFRLYLILDESEYLLIIGILEASPRHLDYWPLRLRQIGLTFALWSARRIRSSVRWLEASRSCSQTRMTLHPAALSCRV
jgi:hypothetical protein